MSRRVTARDDIAAVIALYKANHVLREISAQTGVALRVVQNLVKRFCDLGEDELPAPLPKSGRPKLLSPRTLKVISRQVRSNPSLTAHEVKERNPRLLSHVSLRCVQQALHDDLGFKSFRARRKPLLTKRQKENRVKFCKKYEVWDLETWRRHVNGVRTSCASWSHEQTTQSKEQNFAESSTPHDEESFDHGTEDGEAQLRSHILNAALPFVHSYGWSPDAIAQGAETLGYSSMVHGMFPGGGVELVNHFYSTCNTILEESLKAKVKKVEEKPELKTGTTAFIANAVEERLRMNIEYIDSWHKALALHASPRNTTTALHNLGTLVDHIWYHAGDRSTDFNWYTKRGILAAVYKSSELCMLQDKSEDFQVLNIVGMNSKSRF
ncbi:Ubiquinone biosynthesis protein COQ9-like [Homarus americanus]|uniref:Ubiquinone biosynthesis protein n=1 Tax=Homarus americanus TaxID=6706 RepID=A0A8J5JRT9_HOMAM|nr:Ubiquinone biosynthesis protein COQ9-like [Homarus americanus]